jgi:hypothetical protein
MNHDDEKLFINLLEKRKIYWEPLIASGAILIAIFGVMVPLFIHSDNAARAQIEAIRQDIKDFHKQLYEIQLENRTK